MNAASINGREFHEGLQYPSPAEKIIALGWYDGPTDGILQCRDGKVFQFKMLDTVLDWSAGGEDLRVYELFPLPADALERVISTLETFQSPHWPLWAPIWQFPSAEDQQTVEKRIAAIEGAAGPRRWVIASSDLSSEILAARSESQETETGDVFNRLTNLARDERTRSRLQAILDNLIEN